jgi:hypothetical protein
MSTVIHLPSRLAQVVVERAIAARFPQHDFRGDLMRQARIAGRAALIRRRSSAGSIEAGCQVIRRGQMVATPCRGDAA